jgi:hypothetical protein
MGIRDEDSEARGEELVVCKRISITYSEKCIPKSEFGNEKWR